MNDCEGNRLEIGDRVIVMGWKMWRGNVIGFTNDFARLQIDGFGKSTLKTSDYIMKWQEPPKKEKKEAVQQVNSGPIPGRIPAIPND